MPQGSLLGPVLFALSIDGVFSLDLHHGTRVIGYADDILLLRHTATPLDQAKLQENLTRVNEFLHSVGLVLNPGKCKLLNVALKGSHHLSDALIVDGTPIEESSSLRYLGVLLDNRLSMEAHWSAAAASAKAAIGALSRLVHRDPVALKFPYQERIVSAFFHSLPFLPPTTQAGWRRLNGIASFTAHLVTNQWSVHGLAAVAEAGLRAPGELCFEQSLRFMYQCVTGKRRWGVWFHLEQRQGRVTANRSEGMRHGLELQPVHCRHKTFEKLQPARLTSLWNALPFQQAGISPESAFKSLTSFTSSLPALFQALTTAQRSTFSDS